MTAFSKMVNIFTGDYPDRQAKEKTQHKEPGRFSIGNISLSKKIAAVNILLATVTSLSLVYLVLSITDITKVIDGQNSLAQNQIEMIQHQRISNQAQQGELEQLALANDILRAFSDQRFWLFDLSVSWLNESEDKAEAAKERLFLLLDKLAINKPLLAKNLRKESNEFHEKMFEAVDSYVDENRVIGNSIIASARNQALNIEKELDVVLQQSKQQALASANKVEQASAKVQNVSENLRSESVKVKAENVQLQQVAMIVLAVVIGISFVSTLALRRAILRPVNAMLKAVEDLCSGEGDLTQRLPKFGNDELGRTATALNTFLDKLHHVISNISESIEVLASASNEVKASANSLSQSASEQAISVEKTSSSLEEMTASINSNAECASLTDELASKAASEAREGGEAVRKTISAIAAITKKIDTIDDIARKTNLLALNATIEAARAGDVGKGFAVVAGEVRKLADRCQTTSKEIDDLATITTKAASSAGKLLEEIVPAVDKTAELVQKINIASEEQTNGVILIAQSMTSVDHSSQSNASASEQLAATAEQINGRVEELRSMAGFFKT